MTPGQISQSEESARQQSISLREYVDKQVYGLREIVDLQRSHSEKAIDKAEAALQKRLDGMNEFREALKDQSGRMATREQLDQIRERVAEIDKRAAVTSAIVSMTVSVIVGVIIGLISRWITK